MAIRILPPKRVKKAKSRNSQEVLRRLEQYLENECDDPVRILCGVWEDQQNAISYQELRAAVMEGYLSMETLRLWQQDYSVLAGFGEGTAVSSSSSILLLHHYISLKGTAHQ